jgi:hypothetical protein
MGVYAAAMRRSAGGFFRATILAAVVVVLAAVVVVGCGGRTATSPPDDGSGSVVASASGVANATSGVATGSAAGTVTETSGTFIGASGTLAVTSGTFIGASGTVEASSGSLFFGTSGTSTSGTVFVGASGMEVASSGTTVFVGSSGTLATSGTTTVTGASACGAGASAVPVSFSNDLMPVFQNNCSVGGLGPGALCHGDPSVTSTLALGGTRPYFGPPSPTVSSAATLTMIYEGLVDESSSEDISMSRVAPGEPTQSYVWYKINGIQSVLENESPDACERGDLGSCGSPMPLPLMGFVVAVFAQSNRDLICNWITQGAPNN